MSLRRDDTAARTVCAVDGGEGNSGDLVSTNVGEIIGYVAGGFGVYAFRAKTMIPLRIAATCGCAFSLAYGALRGAGERPSSSTRSCWR